ncbi:enoyl-CoA hydratase-related protein [Micromonospora sp. FIMYZ51]|uniref:enoyl-CoA hydratase/isomerase family protein n=1 Tax=Micromonospora sp. FIMYZ51 TaxID=3051832 RepID=UPI00311FEB7F
MSATESVVVERAGSIMTVTINRPEAYNALNAEVLRRLHAAVRDADGDPAIRAVVITGSGEKAFCAGADLKELAGMGADRAHRTLHAGQRVLRDVERAKIPVIAAVNGVALGGGFELVLASTFAVMSTRASLGLPESGLGLMPGYGGTQRLPRVIGAPAAAHLMLTGARLDAQRAYQLGLSPVPPVDPADLMATVSALAEKIAAQGPAAVRAILTALDTGRDAPLDAGLELETGLAALAVAGVESAEGIAAFLERRPPRFTDPAPASEKAE